MFVVSLKPILRNSGVEREHLASPATRQQSPPGLLHFWVPEIPIETFICHDNILGRSNLQ